MKHIIRSNDAKTVLSIQPGRLSLRLGKDFNDERLKPFLKVIDEIMEDVVNEDVECFAHFHFDNNKIDITLSKNPNKPDQSDLTYRRTYMK